jgi:hypothetical protein
MRIEPGVQATYTPSRGLDSYPLPSQCEMKYELVYELLESLDEERR